MSEPPKRDYRGEQSYQDRLKNYQDDQRRQQLNDNRQRTLESGYKPGRSGMPKQHFVLLPSKARAEDMARSAGNGHTPVRDTPHAPGQRPHYHQTGPTGERGDKNTPHFEYPKKNSNMPSPKFQRKGL